MRGDAALRWTTNRSQQTGDDFTLDLGQELPLKEMKFIQGLQHQWDRPERWRVILSEDKEIVRQLDGEGFIEVELAEPVPIRFVAVVILEPRTLASHPQATCWAVDKIKLS